MYCFRFREDNLPEILLTKSIYYKPDDTNINNENVKYTKICLK